jgi:hypothetical protein
LFLLLLAISWTPAIVRAAQIYVARQLSAAPDFFTVTPSTFREFLAQQVRFLPVVLVSLAAGAATIATDFASGAFSVYLSKPISRLDYLLGKGLPVAAAIGAITLAPALALLAVHTTLAPDFEFLRNAPWLPIAITAYSLFLVLYFTLSVLAVSSLSRSGRVAGAGFAALVFGSELVARTLASRRFGARPLPSFNGAAMDAGSWFFGDSTFQISSLVVVVTVLAVSAFVLDRRLHSGEGAL